MNRNIIDMKGISIIHDTTNNKRYAQIDIETLEEHQEEIEDLIDVIIAESRKGDERIPLEDVIKELEEKGNLDKYV